MYTVYSNTTCLMDPSVSLLLIDPVLDLALNEAGSFSFSVPVSHPAYQNISHQMRVTVSKDDETIFYGRVIDIQTDFAGNKAVKAEGELAYLSDTIQRPAEYHDQSVRGFIQTLLNSHNAQSSEKFELGAVTEGELAYLSDTIQRPAEYHDQSVRGFIQTLLNSHNAQSSEKFELGAVNITDPNDSLYRYTNYEDTLFCLLDKVVDRLGGIIQIRHEGDKRILDILSDYPRSCTQQILFRENLMDYVCSSDSVDLATVVIPLGATIENRSIEALEERVSIASVNDNKDYLEASSAISKYGRICKVVTFDDVHTPSLLKTKGQEWLEHNQYEDLQLEISAVDLSMLDVSVDDFRLLDRIRVQSDYHQINEVFPLTSMTIHLLQPDQNLYHLGGKPASFTSSTRASQVSIAQKVQAIHTPNSLVEEAKEQVTQLLNSFGKYGHVVQVLDEDNHIQEICIIDTEDLETAQNVWRWNMGGLQLLNSFGKYGHVVQVLDEDNHIQEICIIDTEDLETAQNVWRWNMGGLGFSSSGYAGPYTTAMTMDGTIAGNMVAANSITAEKLDISYRSSVEQDIAACLNSAKADTDEKLKNYWTQAETETRINSAKDAITLSVTQQAQSYLDAKLVEYYTKSEIDLKTDSIALQVYQASAQSDNLLPYTSDWSSTYTWKRHANCSVLDTYTSGAKTMQYNDSVSGDVEILTTQAITVNFSRYHYYTFSGYFHGSTNSPITLEIRTGRALPEPVKVNSSSSYLSVQADQTTGVITATIKPPTYDHRISLTFRVGRALPEPVKVNSSSSYLSVQADQTTGVITATIKPPTYDHRISLTFRVGLSASSSTFGITLKKTGAPGTSNIITFSRFKLEKGRTATDYQKKFSELTTSQASILMNYDSIVSTVSTKVGINQIASYIQQNAEAVRIAWSNISEYIEFSDGAINIYSYSSKTDANRLMRLNQSGLTFWGNGYQLGSIGVNNMSGMSTTRGLTFDLDYNGSYMAWACQTTSDSLYNVKMLFANKSFSDYTAGHLYFSAPVDFFDTADFHNHSLTNANLQQPDIVNSSGYSGFGSWSSPVSIKLPSSINSDGTVQEWYDCKISGGVIY